MYAFLELIVYFFKFTYSFSIFQQKWSKVFPKIPFKSFQTDDTSHIENNPTMHIVQ